MDAGFERMTNAIEKAAEALGRIAAAMEEPKGSDVRIVANEVIKDMNEKMARKPIPFA